MAQTGSTHAASGRGSAGGYGRLAELYDELFGPFQQPLQRARAQVLGAILPRVQTACDLGCGTGTTALRLAARGIRVYAVDMSPIMCRLARRKARAADAQVKVLRADMRTLRLPEQVDLVVCEGDALNHVPHKRDLGRVARGVFKALSPGGSFYFDVNNRAGFLAYWTGTVWLERRRAVVVMRNGHSAYGQRAWADVETFLRERGKWLRRHERVEEVCWSAQEIVRALRQAGFDRVSVWDAAPFFGSKSVVAPGCRSVYLAHRPE